jgi:hypothetical protein
VRRGGGARLEADLADQSVGEDNYAK